VRESSDGLYLEMALEAEAAVVCATLPVTAVYLLDRSPSSTGVAEIRAVSGREAVMSIVADTWAGRVLAPEDRGAELDIVSRLVNRAHLRRIVQRAGRGADVTSAVIEDLRSATPMSLVGGASHA
jgi:hypothetical protein